MGRQIDDQLNLKPILFENCDWDIDRAPGRSILAHGEFLYCIGRNVERLIKHYHRQFPENPSLLGSSKKLMDFDCGRTLNNTSTKAINCFIFWTFFQNVMITLLIPMETIARSMLLKVGAH